MNREFAARLMGLLDETVVTRPCGIALNVEIDRDYQWIDDQLGRTTAIPPLPVDWPEIESRAARLLERSKDWVLFCVLERALGHNAGVAGIAAGTELLRLAAEKFWPEMHPALPRGLARRANYLNWAVEGLAEGLRSGMVSGGTSEEIDAAKEQLQLLDTLLRSLLGDKYSGVRVLRQTLDARQEGAEASTGSGAAVAGVAASSAGAVEFPPPVTSVDVADQVVGKVREALFAVAEALQEANAADPKAFRLRRVAAWLNFDGAPAFEDGRLLVRGPDPEQCARLRSALESDPQGVLREAEAALQSFPLWIDASYLAILALRRFGASRAEACDAVRLETVGFVRRMPGLLELAFADDVPLADPDTREWLEGELAKVEGAPPGEAPASTVVEGRLAEAEQAAGEAAARGEIDRSFEIFREGIRENGAGRERFRWRLAAARHAARNGRTDLALDLLEGLDREARERSLELWEPELCAEVLLAAFEVGNKGRGRRGKIAPEVLDRFPEIHKRLASIDLMAALRMGGDRP